ncbi:hypothetical protein C5167_003496, partial [Papaver somniferum]
FFLHARIWGRFFQFFYVSQPPLFSLYFTDESELERWFLEESELGRWKWDFFVLQIESTTFSHDDVCCYGYLGKKVLTGPAAELGFGTAFGMGDGIRQ